METVDLHTMPALTITHMMGEDVAKYLYEAPTPTAWNEVPHAEAA